MRLASLPLTGCPVTLGYGRSSVTIEGTRTFLSVPHVSSETIEEGTVVAQGILFRSRSTAGLAGLKEDRQGQKYVKRYLLAVYLHGASRPIRRL
jgi:hypothetical protein